MLEWYYVWFRSHEAKLHVTCNFPLGLRTLRIEVLCLERFKNFKVLSRTQAHIVIFPYYKRVSKPIYTCKWTWVSEWLWTHLLIWVSEWVRNHLLIWVREWVRTHLLILVCVCEWELTSRFQCVCVSVSSPPDFSVWVSENSPPDLSVCVWVRENWPPHLCLWVSERTHLPSALPSNHMSDNLLANRILDGQTDGHTRFSAETLNPKPGHTQEDTHYTEW